jgi:hypothetical protein
MVKDRQVMELRYWLGKEATLSVAELKTGMDRKTARKYRRRKLPSEEVREHYWSTRCSSLPIISFHCFFWAWPRIASI